MKLKGQAGEDFENYLMGGNQFDGIENYDDWDKNYPECMKFGMLVDWFDTVGIYIHVHLLEYGFDEYGLIHECEIIINDEIFERGSSRFFARLKAVEKANEKYNNNYER